MKRLFDDPALPDDLRTELLRAQRAGREYDVMEKLPQLREALDSAPPTADDLLEEDGATQLPGAQLTPLVWKLALLATIAGAVAYIAWPAPMPSTAPAPQPGLAVRPAEPGPPSPVVRAPVPVVAEPEPQPVELAAPEPVQAKAPRTTDGSSRREIAQLVRIRALLERDPAAAARLAQRGDQEFPNGVLHEERRALQAVALAKSGDREAAERKASDFYTRYPQSPLRELVEAAIRR